MCVCVCVCVLYEPEYLQKMSLEELREFLQERISQTFLSSDDAVVEHLQTAMTELRRMKLDLPPPGKGKMKKTPGSPVRPQETAPPLVEDGYCSRSLCFG